MAGFVVALRWRTSTALPRDQWKRDSAQFGPNDTVGDLRARLAAARGSTAELAADFDPELWLCDGEGRPAEKDATRPSAILRWTCATCPPALRASQENGEPVAVLVFTFPPASAPPPAPPAAVAAASAQKDGASSGTSAPRPPLGPERLAHWRTMITELTGPTELAAGAVIRFSPAAAEVAITELPHGVFVRQCYLDLLAIVDTFAGRPRSRLRITGTPGIGKSAFLLLLARTYLLAGKRVVLQVGKKSKEIVLLALTPAPAVESITPEVLEDEQFDVYLTDAEARAVPVLSVFTVAAMSPVSKQTAFTKHSEPFYMPVWTKEELDACHRLLYAEFPADDVAINYLRWGGIPRFVFTSVSASEKEMDEAIAKASTGRLEDIFAGLANSFGSADLVDRLCHIFPSPSFGFASRRIASLYVLERLVNVYFEDLRNGRLRLMLETMRMPDASTMIGYMFEDFVHRLFETSPEARLEMRPLHEPSRPDEPRRRGGSAAETKRRRTEEDAALHAWFQVPGGMAVQRFRNLDELGRALGGHGLPESVYYWPYVRNLESGDAFMRVGGTLYVFQDTVSLTHDIKGPGVAAIVNLLSAQAREAALDVRFVFRVPDVNYHQFQHQKLLRGRDAASRPEMPDAHGDRGYAVLPAQLRGLRQYVMRVPLGPPAAGGQP